LEGGDSERSKKEARECASEGCPVLVEPVSSTFGDRVITVTPAFCDGCVAVREARQVEISKTGGRADRVRRDGEGQRMLSGDGERKQWKWLCSDEKFMSEKFEIEKLPAAARRIGREVLEGFHTKRGKKLLTMPRKGVGLLGPTGVGKSRILYELFRLWYCSGRATVCLLPVAQFARVCASMNGNEERLKMIRRAIEADFLLLDDIGKEKPTVRVETDLFDILDARYRAAKPLFVATNFTGDQLAARFSEENGAAMVRRIKETCGFRTITQATSGARSAHPPVGGQATSAVDG
jgi:DNA replication protein DnaC